MYILKQRPEDQDKQAESQRREAEMKNSILTQILAQDARARRRSTVRIRRFKIEASAYFFTLTNVFSVNSIALVKPEKAQAVENMLIQMAKSGRLPGKVCLLCAVSVRII